jgi:hypothetical protein
MDSAEKVVFSSTAVRDISLKGYIVSKVEKLRRLNAFLDSNLKPPVRPKPLTATA